MRIIKRMDSDDLSSSFVYSIFIAAVIFSLIFQMIHPIMAFHDFNIFSNGNSHSITTVSNINDGITNLYKECISFVSSNEYTVNYGGNSIVLSTPNDIIVYCNEQLDSYVIQLTNWMEQCTSSIILANTASYLTPLTNNINGVISTAFDQCNQQLDILLGQLPHSTIIPNTVGPHVNMLSQPFNNFPLYSQYLYNIFP